MLSKLADDGYMLRYITRWLFIIHAVTHAHTRVYALYEEKQSTYSHPSAATQRKMHYHHTRKLAYGNWHTTYEHSPSMEATTSTTLSSSKPTPHASTMLAVVHARICAYASRTKQNSSHTYTLLKLCKTHYRHEQGKRRHTRNTLTKHGGHNKHHIVIEQADTAYHARGGAHRQIVECHVTLVIDGMVYLGNRKTISDRGDSTASHC